MYAHRLPHQLPESRGIMYTAVADGLANYGRLELMVRGLPEPRVLVDSAADVRYLPSGHLAFVRRGTLMLMPFDLETLAVTGAAAPVHDGVLQAIGSDLRPPEYRRCPVRRLEHRYAGACARRTVPARGHPSAVAPPRRPHRTDRRSRQFNAWTSDVAGWEANYRGAAYPA